MLNFKHYRILRNIHKDFLKCSSNTFSSKGKDPKTSNEPISVPSETPEKQWNEYANWELLGMRGYRFCLPGNVGLPPTRKLRATEYKKVARPKKTRQLVKLPETIYMRHMEIVAQLSALAGELSFIPREPRTFHCDALDCPYLLRDQVMALFPQASIGQGPLTAVCVALRILPKNYERDWQHLVHLYEETARRVCSKLNHAGFWADYPSSVVLPVDPASADQIEAAHNLSPPGLSVRHITGCVLLVHAPFGESRILGWLFTTAPHDDPILSTILKTENA
ncbi:hypothetical protein B566_EDAN010480 [Ephemera danica]|nr:hypothetical protein B566_EDAN010480 [Ephemera danica]